MNKWIPVIVGFVVLVAHLQQDARLAKSILRAVKA
jgi:hypothetical protein